ncbi:MAG: hypothetical protein CWE10_04145 [Symbiobacterium thermophilum]|uniref:Uncharacterized protein n=1 Tax=Symbiobacterium thermophilum TaxID=2734 RepID=A0A953I0Q1_SYMTR|nr:hypothetical protein [Symbiobacterium thermophilum]
MPYSYHCLIEWPDGHTRSLSVTEARNAYIAARRARSFFRAFNCVIRVHDPTGTRLLAQWKVDAAGVFTRLPL